MDTGHVLIEGGVTTNKSYTAQSELFDAKTGIWRKTGILKQERAKHTATLLPGGKVLVTGGIGTAISSSAELYDPATETWMWTKGAMRRARVRHTATLLQTGEVLVVGGVDDYVTELYDPATDTWSEARNMLTYRFDHVAVRLLDGTVLLAGGRTRYNGDQNITNSAELYDPKSNTWTSLASMNIARERGHRGLTF